MPKSITWIVVADGARARVFRSEGWGSGLEPVESSESEAATRPTRALGTDRPGRVHESADVARHAMAPRVDWHRFEKARFANEIAAMLVRGRKAGAFDRLVMVAPPKTLGDLRGALDKETRNSISAELDKDLTHVPPTELRKHIEKITPV